MATRVKAIKPAQVMKPDRSRVHGSRIRDVFMEGDEHVIFTADDEVFTYSFLTGDKERLDIKGRGGKAFRLYRAGEDVLTYARVEDAGVFERWSLDPPQSRLRFEVSGRGRQLSMSALGSLVLSAGLDDGRVTGSIVDTQTGRVLSALEPHALLPDGTVSPAVGYVDLCDEGNLAVVGGNAGALLFEVASGKRVRTIAFDVFENDGVWVPRARLSPDGRVLVVRHGKRLVCYDTASGELLHEEGFLSWVEARDGSLVEAWRVVELHGFFPDGRLIYSLRGLYHPLARDSRGATEFFVADPRTGKVLDRFSSTMPGHLLEVSADWLLFGQHSRFSLWHAVHRTQRVTPNVTGHSGAIEALAWGDGFLQSFGDEVLRWCLDTGSLLKVPSTMGKGAYLGLGAAASANQAFVVTRGRRGCARWTLDEAEPQCFEIGDLGQPSDVSADGRWVVTGGQEEESLAVWDLKEESIRVFEHVFDEDDECLSLSRSSVLTADASRLLSVNTSVSPLLWSSESEELLMTLAPRKGGYLDAVVETHDLVIAADDVRLYAWNLATGAFVGKFTGPGHKADSGEAGITVLAIDSAGAKVASGAEDSRVRIWDIPSRKLILTLSGVQAPITAIAFAPDGAQLAAGDTKGQVYIWDIE